MGLPKLTPVLRDGSTVRVPSSRVAVAGESAWMILGQVGAVLFLIGMVDLLLAWFPLSLGNPEWEFGTISVTLNGLPVPAVGLALLLASAVKYRQRWLLRALAVLSGLLGLAIIGAGLLYATDVPLALRAVGDGVMREGLTRAITKTSVQALLYPPLFLWLAIQAWRHSAPAARESL